MINRATINDLQRLCKVNSPQVMLIFVKNHLAEINRDGEHAEKIGKSWLFDEIAVKRIMELRAQTTHARADKETPEQAELRQARIVVTKAQQQIIMLQNKTIEDAQHIIKLTEGKAQAEAQAQILEAKLEGTEAQLATATSEKEGLKLELERLQVAHQSAQAQLLALEKAKIELERMVVEEKSKGFFDRLFNR